MDMSVQNFAVAHLRRRPEPVEIGGFVAGFDPATPSSSVNYATPLPGAAPTSRDVAALVETFRARGLSPRLEFVPGAAPAVEGALREAGFTTEAAHVYLVCTPETLNEPGTTGRVAPDPVVATPSQDADYAAVDIALTEAFTGEAVPSPGGAARLRRTQEGGGGVRFVRAPDGGCAGAAACSAPAAGTAELSSVGTRPAFRGRGIASAVTAALTRNALATGATSVWLEYSGDGSRRVYERLGYLPRGTRLYLALEG